MIPLGQVVKGQLIGYVETDINKYPQIQIPHLHFGIRSGQYSEENDPDGYPRYRGYAPANIVGLWYSPSHFITQDILIIDEYTPFFEKYSTYWWEKGIGYNYHMWWTYADDTPNPVCWGRWNLNSIRNYTEGLFKPGQYEVFAFIPSDGANSKKAKYEIKHNNKTSYSIIDQSIYSNEWVSLGIYDFASGGEQYVRLNDNTEEDYSLKRMVGYDAIKFQYVGTTETLSVSLTATPSSGTAPLPVTFSADISYNGSATTTNYTFWWNCNDPGTSVSNVMAVCGSISTPPWGSCASNSNGYKCDGVTDDPKIVYYTYPSAGTYTAKVIAERGSAPPDEDRKTITVTAPCDTIPDAFTFTDQIGVGLNTVVTSNTITVSGITCAAPISISSCTSSSCQYSINSGAYTNASGTVNNGDSVTVRQTSSGIYSTTTSATLTIGGISDTFSVTTMAAPLDTTPPTLGTPQIYSNNIYGSYYSGSSINIRATASDTQSGINGATCEYSINNGVNWNSANWDGTYCYKTGVGVSGTINLKFRVKDNANNPGTSITKLIIKTTMYQL